MDDAPNTVSDSAAARFLAVAARELERLRTESEYAAGEINAAATAEGVDNGSAIADLAVALRERAAEIAAECDRLDRLVSAASDAQAAALAAAQPSSAPGEPGPPVEAAGTPGGSATEDSGAMADGVGEALEPSPGLEVPAPPPVPETEPAAVEAPVAAADPGIPALEEDEEEEYFTAPAPHADLPPEEVSEGVKLLVTQMAVGGSPRREIERRLEDEFGIADPARVLAELFGPQG